MKGMCVEGCLVDLLSYFSHLLGQRAGNPLANSFNAGLLEISSCLSVMGTELYSLNSGAPASVTALLFCLI